MSIQSTGNLPFVGQKRGSWVLYPFKKQRRVLLKHIFNCYKVLRHTNNKPGFTGLYSYDTVVFSKTTPVSFSFCIAFLSASLIYNSDVIFHKL